MLGLAEALRPSVECRFLTFPEQGRGAVFVEQVRHGGFEAVQLDADFPRVGAAVREIAAWLRRWEVSVVLCHGYKANLLGRVAARRAGAAAVAVSRGWTWESWRVRLYEWLDRRHLRWMDHVVCVSQGQAERVRRWCGVPPERISIIHNSARWEAFANIDRIQSRRQLMREFFGDAPVCGLVVGAGRLSPEKGFAVLIEAAAILQRSGMGPIGWVIFGEGRLHAVLQQQIRQRGLEGRVVLAGFRRDLDHLLPGADVVVLPSFTEGMPNVALEASAAGVPVVATAVGGTPEVILDGQTGYLVPAGDAKALARRVVQLLEDPPLRVRLGAAAQKRMREQFSFSAQAAAYRRLLEHLSGHQLVSASPSATHAKHHAPAQTFLSSQLS